MKGKPIVFFYAALDMSRNSLGYDHVALKESADGVPINFHPHQRIKSAVSWPLTTAVAASGAEVGDLAQQSLFAFSQPTP